MCCTYCGTFVLSKCRSQRLDGIPGSLITAENGQSKKSERPTRISYTITCPDPECNTTFELEEVHFDALYDIDEPIQCPSCCVEWDWEFDPDAEPQIKLTTPAPPPEEEEDELEDDEDDE